MTLVARSLAWERALRALPLRDPRIDDRAAAFVAYSLERLFQGRHDLLRARDRSCECAAGGCSDAAVIRIGRELGIEGSGAARGPFRVHTEDPGARGAPAPIVIDDLQERRGVSARHPVHR